MNRRQFLNLSLPPGEPDWAKGFRVITCTGWKPQTSVVQAEDMARFVKYATDEMKPRYLGVMQTVWSHTDEFIDSFYGKQSPEAGGRINQADGFKAMYKRIDELEKMN